MNVFYDQSSHRLVQVENAALEEHWEEHWAALDIEKMHREPRYPLVEQYTKTFLPEDSIVLEGGCGTAVSVAVLARQGYRSIGLDFAGNTLRRVRRAGMKAPLIEGDVFSLPLQTGSVDGCWSLGVIEHFYSGYAGILQEVARVLRPGGVFFLTFPQINAQRARKLSGGAYPSLPDDFSPDMGFYQFLLDPEVVKKDLCSLGFSIEKQAGYDGLKGFKDELGTGRALLQKLYDSQFLPLKITRKCLNVILSGHSAHMCLLVARKNL